MQKERCRIIWYILLVILILTFIGLAVSMTLYLFTFFVPHKYCKLNSTFISIMSSSCFIFFIFAIIVAAKTSK
jgi:hypothetical protein